MHFLSEQIGAPCVWWGWVRAATSSSASRHEGIPAVTPADTGTVRTVCVVGAGGREHALALALGRTADVVVTPGNPGIGGSPPRATPSPV